MNGAALCALNAELGVAMDTPDAVAAALVALLANPARRASLGLPEKLFARLNQLVPGLVDRALRRQLPVIRRHARRASLAHFFPGVTPEHSIHHHSGSHLHHARCDPAGDAGVDEDVRALQREWEEIKYRKPGPEQEKAFQTLAATAAGVRAKYADRAEPEIWYGIIVASHAGAKGGLGALSLAKDAKAALEHAIELDPKALGRLRLHQPGFALLPGAGLADRLRRRREGPGAPAQGARSSTRTASTRTTSSATTCTDRATTTAHARRSSARWRRRRARTARSLTKAGARRSKDLLAKLPPR